MKKLRIGTRPSALALRQVEEIRALLDNVPVEVVAITTPGDRDKISPLKEFEGSDFFTRDIERRVLNGSIDAAVHSAKDLEEDVPPGLVIAAVTASISNDECLVSQGDRQLDELPFHAVVGTSSRKRAAALSRYRADLIVKDIRGNVDDRLRRLDSGDFDAIIVAEAALIRLGLTHRISQVIPREIMAAHPLQGRLAIQVKAGRKDMINLFQRI